MEKLKEVLKSAGFKVSAFTIAILAFISNDIAFDKTPEEVYNMLEGQTGFVLISIVVFLFLVPVSKMVRLVIDKGWNWGWINDANVITALGTMATLVIGAFIGEELATVVVSLLINLINIVWNSRQPKEGTATPAPS